MRDFEVLVDTNAFVGLFVPFDAHHARSLERFTQLAKQHIRIVTTSYVIAETATVISRHLGQDLARRFLEYVASQKLPVIHIDEALQHTALTLFAQQEKKRTSVFDCATVAAMRQFGIPKIFGYDEVYHHTFGLNVIK